MVSADWMELTTRGMVSRRWRSCRIVSWDKHIESGGQFKWPGLRQRAFLGDGRESSRWRLLGPVLLPIQIERSQARILLPSCLLVKCRTKSSTRSWMDYVIGCSEALNYWVSGTLRPKPCSRTLFIEGFHPVMLGSMIPFLGSHGLRLLCWNDNDESYISSFIL